MEGGREVDEAEEAQGSKDEDGAVVQQWKKTYGGGRGNAEKQP